jgi:hypothetical protein
MTPVADIAGLPGRRAWAWFAPVVAASLTGLSSSCGPARAVAPTTMPPPPSKLELEAWRRSMLKVTRPKNNACYAATYPDREWHEAPCQTPPHKLYRPRNRSGMTTTTIVGGIPQLDFSPVVTPSHITEAEGSFDSVNTSGAECSVPCPSEVCPTNPSCSGLAANVYSMQLNTRPFTTSTCQGSPGGTQAPCEGWEQFVYSGTGGAYIQYWLEHYGPPGTLCPMPRHAGCAPDSSYPDGWCPFQFTPTGDVYCVVNAAVMAGAPAAPVSSFGSLTATAASGTSNDSIAISVGNSMSAAPGSNYFPDLGSQWQESEFNVFGDGDGSQAVFGTGTTLTVRSGVTSGSTSGPSCDLQSFTGESNNLTLVNVAPTAVPGPMPALVFSESVPPPGGATAACMDATSIGDTHLTTFSGLYYDFQATGDFVLADRGPSFVVQNRQVSGAPTWPNAAVNSAVAARMGRTTVAVCLPERLEINGRPANVNDGSSMTLPDGVVISRTGSTYLITNEQGDSLSAQVNSTWINASVGLGRWPTKVRGLLANPKDDPHLLATSDGFELTEPVPFEALYRRYGDSWRVKNGESILCGSEPVEKGVPAKPFYAADLDRLRADHARAVCLSAGVKEAALLDSCTLDVAVIGRDEAAKIFATKRPPVFLAPH